MSHVTTVVIVSADRKNEDRNVATLNSWLKENDHLGCEFSPVKNSENCAGTKYPQRRLYWGGLNFLSHNKFIDIFRSLNWENTVLILGYEEQDLGYNITPSKYDNTDCPLEILTEVKY